MLQITNDEALSTQVTKDKRNETILAGAGSGSMGGEVDGNIKNLSTVINLVKKSKSTRFKKIGLLNTKANSKTDFLTLGTKTAFIHLQKTFIEAPILKHFDLEHYIRIETDILGYAINGVLSQMILDDLDHSNHLDPLEQLFSDYVIHKNLDPISSQSKICQ